MRWSLSGLLTQSFGGKPLHQLSCQPVPHTAPQLKPVASSGSLSQVLWRRPSDAGPIVATEPFEIMWKVYSELGARGLLFSPLLINQPEQAKDALQMRLGAFEASSLQGHVSAWRRWRRFVASHEAADKSPLFPSIEAVFAFLQTQASRGPTVSHHLFQQLLWWRTHVGVPFPLHDPLLQVWNRPAEGHQAAPKEPLALCAVKVLASLAACGPPTEAAFAGFVLMPLAACLRFAHLQRSCQLRVDGPFLLGLCKKGKSRRQHTWPPFEWGCPAGFFGFESVFLHALRVVNDVAARCDKTSFVVPDLLLGPSMQIQSDATWVPRAMPLSRFVSLLRKLLVHRLPGLGLVVQARCPLTPCAASCPPLPKLCAVLRK